MLLHLAWVSNSQRNYKKSTINQVWEKKTINLAEACFEAKIKFCGVGSIAEVTDFGITNLYASSKRNTRKAIQEISKEFLWIRPSYILGLSQGRPRFVTEIRNNSKPIMIHNGNESQDFILLQDVLQGILIALERNLTGIVDIGSGRCTKVAEIAKAIAKKFGKPEPLVSSSKEMPNHYFESNILRNHGWRPHYTDTFFDATWEP